MLCFTVSLQQFHTATRWLDSAPSSSRSFGLGFKFYGSGLNPKPLTHSSDLFQKRGPGDFHLGNHPVQVFWEELSSHMFLCGSYFLKVPKVPRFEAKVCISAGSYRFCVEALAYSLTVSVQVFLFLWSALLRILPGLPKALDLTGSVEPTFVDFVFAVQASNTYIVICRA